MKCVEAVVSIVTTTFIWINFNQSVFLQEITISGSPIREFSKGAFRGLSGLKRLRLAHCNIKYMPPLGPTKHTLELLDLSVNNLMVVETNYFVGFHRLVTLYLNLNCLSAIPNIFSLAGILSTFAISHNMVLSLKRFVNNETFPKLRRLSVSHNNVSELTSVMISQWPGWAFLTLNIIA